MNTQDEKTNTTETSAYNPFPEPQTIPTGWDTSAFFSDPQVAVDEQVKVPVEREDH